MAYHGKDCQRAHWRAGHRGQCQPVETGSLDWPAEAAAAAVGLAAWEQAGEGGGLPAHERLQMAQMQALVEQRQAAGLPGDILTLVGAAGPSAAGAPRGARARPAPAPGAMPAMSHAQLMSLLVNGAAAVTPEQSAAWRDSPPGRDPNAPVSPDSCRTQ